MNPFHKTTISDDPMPRLASSVVRELYRARYDREDVTRFAYAVLELMDDQAVDLADAAE